MNFLGFLSESWFGEAINSIGIMLCRMIYSIICILYDVFNNIAKVNLFSKDIFEDLTGKIYELIGIAMLFIFAYNIVLMIIDPDDKKSSGGMGKMVKETIISLILLILLPTIFNWAYVFQNDVLDSNVIPKIFLSQGNSDQPTEEYCNELENNSVLADKLSEYNTRSGIIFKKNGTTDVHKSLVSECKESTNISSSEYGAYTIAPILLSTFYYPNNFTFDECVAYMEGDIDFLPSSAVDSDEIEEDKKICANYYFDIKYSYYSGSISQFSNDKYLISIVSDTDKDSIEFNGLMAIIAGCIAGYMFFAYAIEVGVRVAKLAVLQLISPVPVLLKIIPKQKSMYDKWLKNLIDTYVDVFIRLLIISFVLYAISLVPGVINTLFSEAGAGSGNFVVKMLTITFVILGLLQFGRECPDLLKEFFGSSGKYSTKGSLKKLASNVSPGVSAVRSGVYGATTGNTWKDKISGAFSGFGRGLVGGYDKAVKGIDTSRTERASGSTFFGRSLDRTRNLIGMETRGQFDERNKNRIQSQIESEQAIDKSISSIKEVVSKSVEKPDSKTQLNGFVGQFSHLNGKNYSEAKAYGDVLQAEINNAKTDDERKEAYNKKVEFDRMLEQVRKETVNSGIDAILSQSDSNLDGHTFSYSSFNPGERASVETEIANIKSKNNGNGVSSFTEYDGLKTDNSEKLRENNELLNESVYTDGYQARQADDRIVRNQGKSEKK